MHVQISRRGKPQERMFFLFSDMMIYGKPKLLDSGNNSYSCCCVLPLKHCQVEKVLGTVQRSDGGGMFRVGTPFRIFSVLLGFKLHQLKVIC